MLLSQLNNIFPGISFKPKPYEMQVHWETPEPVRFKLQNFFSEDIAEEPRGDCCCSSAGQGSCL